ncbi:hypothetical protein [Aminipila sp.]|uniref:hypothetical protein n=1 Tax=Aminipila sp. TaxID=2060095 RepID=UPI0028A037BF|nr:hypothetical protein [Aminipila sp.]
MKIKSKILLSIILVGISISATSVEASAQSYSDIAQPVSVNSTLIVKDSGIVTPQAQIIGWRYKSVDGDLYRRLYNYSTGEWIGEWELC